MGLEHKRYICTQGDIQTLFLGDYLMFDSRCCVSIFPQCVLYILIADFQYTSIVNFAPYYPLTSLSWPIIYVKAPTTHDPIYIYSI